MSGSAWSAAAVVACLLLAAVVGLDRNRVRRRLARTEGALAALRIELGATQDRVEELRSYLSRPSSWESKAVAPAALIAPGARDVEALRSAPDPAPSDVAAWPLTGQSRTD